MYMFGNNKKVWSLLLDKYITLSYHDSSSFYNYNWKIFFCNENNQEQVEK